MFDSIMLADASEGMVKVEEAEIAEGNLEHVKAMHPGLTRDETDFRADVIIVSLVLLTFAFIYKRMSLIIWIM